LGEIHGAAYRGKFGIRVKTGHKNTAEDVRAGKITACILAQVSFHSPRRPLREEVGVRKRFCQSVIQQAVFTRMKLNRSCVREGLRFWTDPPTAGNYTYPEHTPTRGQRELAQGCRWHHRPCPLQTWPRLPLHWWGIPPTRKGPLSNPSLYAQLVCPLGSPRTQN
jgi:hypothetical protein